MAEDIRVDDDASRLAAAELRAVFHSVSDAIFVHGLEGEVVDVNRAAAEMYGYTREQLRDGDVGPVSSGVPPYTAENAAERIERAAAGESLTFEWQGQDSDGNVFWEEVSLSRAVVDGDLRVVAVVRDIDDRKEVERRFQTLIDNLPGVVYRCRNETGWPMEFVGGECERLTGYDAAAVESGEVSWGRDIVHPDDRKRIREDIQKALDRGDTFEITYRIRTAGGDQRWVLERGQRVDTTASTTEHLEGFVTDVTERRELEQELQEYRQAVEWADTPIAAIDQSLSFLFANDAYLDFHAPDREGVTGDRLPDILSSEEFEAAQPRVADVLDGDVVEYETTRTHPDLGERDFAANYYPIRDKEGDVRGAVGIFHDITERNEREAELQELAARLDEERQKYSTVVEQSHDGLSILQDERFVFVNPQMERITGYESSELLGRPFPDLVATEDRDMARERYEKRLDPDASPPSRYELDFVTADGEQRVAEVSAARIQYDGAPADLLSVRDVTAQKDYERRLEQQRDNLELLNRVLRHDIRNDLQVVLAHADLLADRCEESVESVGKVRDRARHAVELTATARDMADMMLTTDDDHEDVPLRRVLERELDELRSAHTDAVITAEGSIPRATVVADDMLDSVFRNLLQNAVQHNDKAIPEVTVSVTARDDTVSVRVADNGPGIPDDRKETVFGKGEKGLDSEGTGIGLHLVQMLVESYGGDVWVEDNDPEGAVFVVELPRAG